MNSIREIGGRLLCRVERSCCEGLSIRSPPRWERRGHVTRVRENAEACGSLGRCQLTAVIARESDLRVMRLGHQPVAV